MDGAPPRSCRNASRGVSGALGKLAEGRASKFFKTPRCVCADVGLASPHVDRQQTAGATWRPGTAPGRFPEGAQRTCKSAAGGRETHPGRGAGGRPVPRPQRRLHPSRPRPEDTRHQGATGISGSAVWDGDLTVFIDPVASKYKGSTSSGASGPEPPRAEQGSAGFVTGLLPSLPAPTFPRIHQF